jgi:hypothetical protein
MLINKVLKCILELVTVGVPYPCDVESFLSKQSLDFIQFTGHNIQIRPLLIVTDAYK